MDPMLFPRYWTNLLEATLEEYEKNSSDGSHDTFHFKRVQFKACHIFMMLFRDNREKLTQTDDLSLGVIICAGLLHDIENVPKNSPNRSLASKLSAEKATKILYPLLNDKIGDVDTFISRVRHAIEAHSFSAGIPPTTIEAKVIQDSDRLESLGVIGCVRCFYIGHMCGREPYNKEDPLAKNRDLDDSKFSLDHFNIKVCQLPGLMNTEFGKERGKQLFEFIEQFIQLVANDDSDALMIIDDIIFCSDRQMKLVGDISLMSIMKTKLSEQKEYYTIFYNQFNQEINYI